MCVRKVVRMRSIIHHSQARREGKFTEPTYYTDRRLYERVCVLALVSDANCATEYLNCYESERKTGVGKTFPYGMGRAVRWY